MTKSNQKKEKWKKKIQKFKNENKFKLKNFTVKTLKKFAVEIAWRLKSSRGDKIIKIKYKEKIIMIKKIIKYFYFYARFIILNDVKNIFQFDSFSTYLKKLNTNVILNRIYAEIVKDFVSNKIWNKSRKWRTTIENQMYLQFFDKKSKKIQNWTIVINVVMSNFKYHFIDIHGFRISKDHIW